jgi:predicted regulator of Ras-like GTPase activity (Roadblock/LC7/MglB family)
MRLAIKRLARVATIAAAIVASSDSLVMAQPLFATLGEVASRLTAGFSEVEEVRRKITEAHAQRYWVPHSS